MTEQLPEWERLLRAAARLQGILLDATLVGGVAAAIGCVIVKGAIEDMIEIRIMVLAQPG
ncbi:MAG: hypothetical protein ABI555_05650 [Chloroflexota bacterium]